MRNPDSYIDSWYERQLESGFQLSFAEWNAMTDIFALACLFLGLLGVLKEWHLIAMVHGDDLAYARSSSGLPAYHDDEQIRQFRRRERERYRRAAESNWNR